jgi:hypothetical protein
MTRRTRVLVTAAALVSGACSGKKPEKAGAETPPAAAATSASSGSPASAASTASTSSAAPIDSLQGIVSVTGTGFEQRLVLQAPSRPVGLQAATRDSAALSRLGGVEVLVRGRADGNSFRVESFTARRVSGSTVLDGMLRLEGSTLVLETAGGRVMFGNPPPALRAMTGARVWISGRPDTGPNSYGVIIPAPGR